MNEPMECDTAAARVRLADGCDTMKQMLTGLLDSKGRVAEEVHALRKLGKSLRGGFSLFGLGKSAALEIQAIGRLLSEPRDAVSRLNTWNKLAWTGDAEVTGAVHGLLEQQTHSAARRPPQETMDWCVKRVDAAKAELLALPAEILSDAVRNGLEKLEKRALKRCGKLDHRAEEDFHEARKAVKAWLGAAGFLGEGVIPLDPKFHDLAEVLGDENDLATLSAWLDNHGFTRRFAPGLWKTIKAARRAKQKIAIRDGRELLGRK
jgi:CHAD domain-containing protein